MPAESEQQQQEPVEQTTPPEQQQTTDWEKRYTDLQPEYTRATQELAQYRDLMTSLQSDDAELQAAAIQALGLELAETEEEDDDTQPSDPVLTARLAKLEQQLQQQVQQQVDQQRVAQIHATVEQQLDALPGDLDETDRDWIVRHAVSLEPTPEGLPDIQAAHAKYTELETAMKQRWAKTKRAPHVSATGAPGTQQPDLDDQEQRVSHMVERLRSMET